MVLYSNYEWKGEMAYWQGKKAPKNYWFRAALVHERLINHKGEHMTSAKQDQGQEHSQIMRELAEQFHPVLESSPMGVYLYLDDTQDLQ